jgi:hypothetical protein
MLSSNELCNYFSMFSFLFLISSKAFQVFSMRVATVMGHTHPGTGEIPSAIFSTDAMFTSPHAFPSIKVQPTSIMIESGFTMSHVIYPGFPIATMSISAVRVISERCGVALLQLMTVAHAFMSMSAIGFPTIFDRPITTTFFPRTSIL